MLALGVRSERGRRELTQAWGESPDGVLREAAVAQPGSVDPGAVLIARVRKGCHLEPDPPAGATGWRFVRGTHSGTYVRDPLGMDVVPEGYDFVTRAPRPRSVPVEEELPRLLTYREWLARCEETRS